MTEAPVAAITESNNRLPTDLRRPMWLALIVTLLCALPLLAANLWIFRDATRDFMQMPRFMLGPALLCLWLWSTALLPFASVWLLGSALAQAPPQVFLSRLRWGRALLFAAITVTPLLPLAVVLAVNLVLVAARSLWSAGTALLASQEPQLTYQGLSYFLLASIPVLLWLGFAYGLAKLHGAIDQLEGRSP